MFSLRSNLLPSLTSFLNLQARLFCPTQMEQANTIPTYGRHVSDQIIHSATCDYLEPDELRQQPSLMFRSSSPSCRAPGSTIDSLAPELLRLIFEQACEGSATDQSCTKETYRTQKSALDVSVKLSHVCRFWREVALATPSLWATIDRFHDGFENFVRRSKGYPIRLNIEAWYEEESFAFTEISFPGWLQHYSSRIHQIFAEGPAETIQNLLDRVGTSLPELVSLDLRGFDQDIALVRTYTPNLRRLFLNRVSTNLNSYTDLTHLTLQGLYYGTHVLAAELVNLLRNSPRLLLLGLSALDLDVADGDVGEIGDVVELAQLQTLNFEELTTNSTIYLISRIRVPPCAPLADNGYNCPPSDQELSLEIFSQRDVVLGACMHSPNGICTFHVELTYSSQRIFSDIKITLSALDTSTMVSLIFIAPSVLYTPPSVDVWFAFLARLPSLAAITLSMPGSWIETFVKALCNHEPGVPCCSLETLTIMDTDPYDAVAYTNLGRITWDYLHARAQSVGLLDLLRLHCGHGDKLMWERVTRDFESCVSYCSFHMCVTMSAHRMLY